MRRYWALVAIAVLVAMSGACEMRLATELVVDHDGSGQLSVSVALDDESADDLIAAGLLPRAGLAEAAAAAPGWTVEEIDGVRAGIRLTHDFRRPEEVAELLAGLSANLGAEDGAAWDGLALRRGPDGSLVLEGRAGVVAPTVAGAEGAAVTFDGEALAAHLDERGREAVRHDLQVVWDGDVGATDADRRDGTAMVWELPTGELRSVSAVLEPSPGLSVGMLVALGLVAALASGIATVLVRRR